MKNYHRLTIVALAVAFATAAPLRAMAQDDPFSDKKVSIDLQAADIRDAIRTLFKDVGGQYTIDQDVEGSVTLTVKDQPFDTALTSILNEANATYRIEGGVFHILLKQAANITNTDTGQNLAPTQETVRRRIKINHADPALIFKLLSGKVQTVGGNFPETSAQVNNIYAGIGGGSGGGGGFGGGGGGFGGGGMGGGFGGGGGGFGGGGGGFGGGGGGFGGGGGGFGGGGGGFGGGGGGGRGGF